MSAPMGIGGRRRIQGRDTDERVGDEKNAQRRRAVVSQAEGELSPHDAVLKEERCLYHEENSGDGRLGIDGAEEAEAIHDSHP